MLQHLDDRLEKADRREQLLSALRCLARENSVVGVTAQPPRGRKAVAGKMSSFAERERRNGQPPDHEGPGGGSCPDGAGYSWGCSTGRQNRQPFTG